FFTTTATPEIYTLSLHDALPICGPSPSCPPRGSSRQSRTAALPFLYKALPSSDPCAATARHGSSIRHIPGFPESSSRLPTSAGRSEEHTSELQSRFDLVCRLLLE